MEHQELEFEVGHQGSPESLQPSLGSPSPIFQLPVADSSNFVGFYKADDLEGLQYWADRSRDMRASGAFTEEPDNSDNLKLLLNYTLGPQSQYILRHFPGDVLIFQLKAYLRGIELLTLFNRPRWLRLFSAWTVSKVNNWSYWPNPAGSKSCGASGPAFLVAGCSRPAAKFYCLVPVNCGKYI